MARAALLFFIILACTAASHACEPCVESLDFGKTAKEADLIVIGYKTGEGPHTDPKQMFGGPDWIEIAVKQVLKGQAENKILTVNSWDGMCPYGILIEEDHDFVIFLKRRHDPEEGYQLDAVNYGCAVKVYGLSKAMVDFNGENIPIDEFTKKLK